MEFDIIDYVLTAIVVVIFPIWGVLDYRRFQRKAAEEAPNARVNQYRLTLAFEWFVVGLILVAWLAKGGGWPRWAWASGSVPGSGSASV